MQILNEAQYEVLVEDIYLNRRQELKTVDKLCDKLLDLVDPYKGLPEDQYPAANKIVADIKKILSNMFNAEIDLELDYSRTEVTNIAYTIFTKSYFKELFFIGDKVLADAKEGYSYVKKGYAFVRVETVALKYMKQLQEGIIQAKGMKSKFNGRHLTAILVHEVGHNIFLSYNIAFRADLGKYVIQTGNSPQLIISPNVLKKNNGVLIKAFFAKLASFLTAIAISLLFSYSEIIKMITLAGSYVVYFLAHIKKKTASYMNGEAHANNLPLQYGYGQEVLDSTIYIPLIQTKTTFNNDMKKYLELQKTLPYQTIIVRDLIIMIKDEMKVATDPKAKKYLSDLLNFAKNILRKTHGEMGIKNDYEETNL